jgi:hypothetical protein
MEGLAVGAEIQLRTRNRSRGLCGRTSLPCANEASGFIRFVKANPAGVNGHPSSLIAAGSLVWVGQRLSMELRMGVGTAYVADHLGTCRLDPSIVLKDINANLAGSAIP